MTKVLVTYFSSTGNTKSLAEAVAEGVRSVEGVTCELKTVPHTTNDDWLAADGIIVGSPTYFGQMAGRVKQMFDVTAQVYGKLEGKVGGAFTTSGGAGCGHETAIMSILTAMLVAGMVVRGTTEGPHFGPFAVGQPNDDALQAAREMGARVAGLTKKLFP
ncbi:MAG TPA: NAD(P)H-dependent oxidoreductase [Anaerolineae bacterium]|nr:NAD(P)H-dependent oxidoreductase [Anaerolineae bacterium]